MDFLWIVLVVAAFGAFFAYYFFVLKPKRGKKKEQNVLDNTGIPGLTLNWADSDLTPKGMRVIWNENPFTNESEKNLAFQCFDVGFENAFNAMKGKFPTWDFNPGFVNIGIIQGNDRTEDGAEAIKMLNGLKIAGAVIGTTDGYPMLTIIIPSQKPNGWRYTDFVMRTVWHEVEHFLEWRSDTKEFLYWGRVVPDSHPHHPLPPDEPEIPAPAPINAIRSLKASMSKIICGTQ